MHLNVTLWITQIDLLERICDWRPMKIALPSGTMKSLKTSLLTITALISLTTMAGCDLLGKMANKTHAQVLETANKREAKLSGEAPVTTPPNTPYGTVMSRDNGENTWFSFSDTADFFKAEDGHADLFLINPGSFTTPNATLIRYGFPAAALEPNAYQNIDYISNFNAAEGDTILVAGMEYTEPNPADPNRADLGVVFTSDEASVDRDVQFVFPATVDAFNILLGTDFEAVEDFATYPDPAIAEQSFFLEEDAASGRMLFDQPESPYFADPADLWVMILADSTNGPTYSFQYLVLEGAAAQKDLVMESLAKQGVVATGLPADDALYEQQTREYIFESYLPDGEINI